jgi:hypothetical protein
MKRLLLLASLVLVTCTNPVDVVPQEEGGSDAGPSGPVADLSNPMDPVVLADLEAEAQSTVEKMTGLSAYQIGQQNLDPPTRQTRNAGVLLARMGVSEAGFGERAELQMEGTRQVAEEVAKKDEKLWDTLARLSPRVARVKPYTRPALDQHATGPRRRAGRVLGRVHRPRPRDRQEPAQGMLWRVGALQEALGGAPCLRQEAGTNEGHPTPGQRQPHHVGRPHGHLACSRAQALPVPVAVRGHVRHEVQGALQLLLRTARRSRQHLPAHPEEGSREQ